MNMLDKLNRRALSKIVHKIRRHAQKKKTDISDHLETLFVESLNMEPKLIVELGVGDGESTMVFEYVANLWNAKLLSVDIEDRAEVSDFRSRIFVHSDDISFAEAFPGWCRQQGFEPVIDILFVDTSHLYEHTVAEIRAWFPYLAPRCKVFFHDTNMQEVFVRRDGSVGKGWDNQRGVIRAIEEYMGLKLDEKRDFFLMYNGWLIRHFTICNGFIILERF